MMRLILSEGPDDMAALRAVAQLTRWAVPVPDTTASIGAGQERTLRLRAGQADIRVSVPSKTSGAAGEGKTALARSIAENLHALRSQVSPEDESYVSLMAVVFDPDDEPASRFHDQIMRAIQQHAPAWTLSETGTPGVWRALRGTEGIDIRAVHWRAAGPVLDGLPDEMNLERVLCAVLAKAYPDDKDHVARFLAEIGERQRAAGRKPARWKAAVHVWLALVYEKADEFSAPARVLHQQDACKAHVQPALAETGLLEDLRPLLAPPQ
jgi:hypothetical protein